ncbi:MAG: CD225/dispanin family protein [Candidatus Brocadiia bacterium]
MFCRKCGAENDDNCFKCTCCGEVLFRPDSSASAVAVPTYMVPAVILTVCCCPLVGFIPILYAAQASSLIAAGNLQAAKRASANARIWCWATFGAGATWVFLSLIAAGVREASK